MASGNQMWQVSREEKVLNTFEREEEDGPKRPPIPVGVVLPSPRPDLDEARRPPVAVQNSSPLSENDAGDENGGQEEDDLLDEHDPEDYLWDDEWGTYHVASDYSDEDEFDAAEGDAEHYAADAAFDVLFAAGDGVPHDANVEGEDERPDNDNVGEGDEDLDAAWFAVAYGVEGDEGPYYDGDSDGYIHDDPRNFRG
jgi:hypothetical protein